MVARIQDDRGEDDRDDAVEPGQARIQDQHQTDDDADRGIGVTLEVLTPGLERDAVIGPAFYQADIADDEIYYGGEADDIDAFVELGDRMRVDKARRSPRR